METLKDGIQRADISSWKCIDEYDLIHANKDWISTMTSIFKYKTAITLEKVETFLGGKVAYIVDVDIAQRYSQYSLDSDWLFVLQKEDGSIHGSFAHCNYKMVWSSVNDFVAFLEKGDKERDNLLGYDEHDRLCEIEEEVE
jgi:hypothetical protein